MSNFNGQDGYRAIPSSTPVYEEVGTVGAKASPPKKIKKLKKDKDRYLPVRTDNEWREMYNNLHEGWKTDLFELRESNNTKELKIIDAEINGLKTAIDGLEGAILFSKELIEEKEKRRMTIFKMREDSQSMLKYRDEEEELTEQMHYRYCIREGRCKVVDKDSEKQ